MADLRQRLLSEQTELLDSIENNRQSANAVELDQTRQGRLSRMDAMQQQAMAQASAQRAKARLRAVAAALKRLEAGEYGECQDCGESIAAKRLQFDPCATLCIACAENREA